MHKTLEQKFYKMLHTTTVQGTNKNDTVVSQGHEVNVFITSESTCQRQCPNVQGRHTRAQLEKCTRYISKLKDKLNLKADRQTKINMSSKFLRT